MEHATGRGRNLLLGASLAGMLGVLGLFKYYGFFRDIAVSLGGWRLGDRLPLIHLLLPVGLSFHTFQSMAYVFEVHAGRQKAERHLGLYALYVLFFPQLVAGPIERPAHLLPQLRGHHDFDSARAISGLRLMAMGMLRNVVLADGFAGVVATVFDSPRSFHGPHLALATLLFGWQIYFDFSGYTQIAIGAARVLGFHLSPNFRSPYLATSLGDFWRRWHISLSSWFRDYLYIRLGGNRHGAFRAMAASLVVFLLCGLWHGANWTFLAWGAWR